MIIGYGFEDLPQHKQDIVRSVCLGSRELVEKVMKTDSLLLAPLFMRIYPDDFSAVKDALQVIMGVRMGIDDVRLDCLASRFVKEEDGDAR